jgi:hypothetical protein
MFEWKVERKNHEGWQEVAIFKTRANARNEARMLRNAQYTTRVVKHGYNDQLAPELQIDVEEGIAHRLFAQYGMLEDDAAQAGRDILRQVLKVFRPEYFT